MNVGDRVRIISDELNGRYYGMEGVLESIETDVRGIGDDYYWVMLDNGLTDVWELEEIEKI